MRSLIVLGLLVFSSTAHAATDKAINWREVEPELLSHFQNLLRIDTSQGNEIGAVDYIKSVFEKENIEFKVFTKEENRPNLVARIKGNGKKKPILLMAHTDVVKVDASKWKTPPFGAVVEDGFIYARGSLDDKDNLAANLMVMLLLKRNNIALDRDVIFLAEAGEESKPAIGIRFMVEEHFSEIDAEYCLAEGGGGTVSKDKVTSYRVNTSEKRPYRLQLVARGPAGHGSVPTEANAIVHLATAIEKVTRWQPPIHFDSTSRNYTERMAQLSPPHLAKQYRAILRPSTQKQADAFFRKNLPLFSATLRNTITPTMLEGGYQGNVIPSEAKALLDVRLLQSQDEDQFVEDIKKVIKDPTVEVKPIVAKADIRPRAKESSISNDAYKAIEAAVSDLYGTVSLPSISTGATDMAFLRARGMQCYGIGTAVDIDDLQKGYGPHADQERVSQSEFYRFARFTWEIVMRLAAQQSH